MSDYRQGEIDFNASREKFARQGEVLKQKGMDAAAQKRIDLLERAREWARHIAQSNEARECDAVQLAEIMKRNGQDITQLGNAAGSVFKGKEWRDTGRRRKNPRPSRHAGEVRIWQWIGDRLDFSRPRAVEKSPLRTAIDSAAIYRERRRRGDRGFIADGAWPHEEFDFKPREGKSNE